MNTFITKSGKVIVVDRFMQGPELTPGYCWQDREPLGSDKKVWHETVSQHPRLSDKLFGYDKDVFLAKQYKRKV